jgi:hypothetical protein
MSNVVHFTADRGCAFRRVIRLKTPDGLPMDLTGYSARLQVRVKPGAELLLEMTVDNGITIQALDGELGLLLLDADMDIPAGRYQYDLKLTDAGGLSAILITGHWIVESRITQ